MPSAAPQIAGSRNRVHGRLEIPLAYVARYVDNELPLPQYRPLTFGQGSLYIELQWIQLRRGSVGREPFGGWICILVGASVGCFCQSGFLQCEANVLCRKHRYT